MLSERLPSDPIKRALEIAEQIEACESTGLAPAEFAGIVGELVDEATHLVKLPNHARLTMLIERAKCAWPNLNWQAVAYDEARVCLAPGTAPYTWDSFQGIALQIRDASRDAGGHDPQGIREGVKPRDRWFAGQYNAEGTDTYHKPARIRDTWNALPMERRKAICSKAPGRVTHAAVVQAIKRRRK
jgi:hypothetical protein